MLRANVTNVTFSYSWRIQCEAQKANGDETEPWLQLCLVAALTAVLTAPLNPIKHAQHAVASPFPPSPSFSPIFFYFLQKGAIDFWRKTDGVGAEQGNGRGVGCLEPSVNSWEVWFHRLAPPCQGSDWAGQEAQERPGLLKDTNRWEAALEGGTPGGIEKGWSPRPATIHRPETEEDGWWCHSRGG